MDHTKIYQVHRSGFSSPRVFRTYFGSVVAFWFFWELIVRVRALGVQSSCTCSVSGFSPIGKEVELMRSQGLLSQNHVRGSSLFLTDITFKLEIGFPPFYWRRRNSTPQTDVNHYDISVGTVTTRGECSAILTLRPLVVVVIKRGRL